jgi:biofilm protein TabA
MLTDHFSRMRAYAAIIPACDAVLAYLAANDVAAFAPGRYAIAGDDVFVLIQDYTTKVSADAPWESHERYADIQLVLLGEEYIGFAPVGAMPYATEYNADKDIVFHTPDEHEQSRVLLAADHCAVFFPGEIHQPGTHPEPGRAVKKAVVKIRVG